MASQDGRCRKAEESPSCAEQRCLTKVREAGSDARRQSRPAHRATGARATETRPDRLAGIWVKRAILPAAISDPAAIRLLAEAESREPLDPRSGRSFGTERDDRQEQNSAYSFFFISSNLGRHGGRPLRGWSTLRSTATKHGAFSSAGQSACLWNKRSRVRTP